MQQLLSVKIIWLRREIIANSIEKDIVGRTGNAKNFMICIAAHVEQLRSSS
jgi:hypothetical protein